MLILSQWGIDVRRMEPGNSFYRNVASIIESPWFDGMNQLNEIEVKL